MLYVISVCFCITWVSSHPLVYQTIQEVFAGLQQLVAMNPVLSRKDKTSLFNQSALEMVRMRCLLHCSFGCSNCCGWFRLQLC